MDALFDLADYDVQQCFDSLNMLSRVLSQWNGMPGFSSSRNGSIRLAYNNDNNNNNN